MKRFKLHELSAERLAELVAVPLPPPPPLDIKMPVVDSANPTKEQATALLKLAYKQLVAGKVPLSPKQFAAKFIAPAILYLES